MVDGVWWMVDGGWKLLNGMYMMSYKKLEAWTYSTEVARQIYILTKTYPSDERYVLVSQTRRAAVSIPCNIAEGLGRNHKRDNIQFLHIARGSAYELETLLCLAFQTEIIKEEPFDTINNMLESNIRLISGFINYLEQKP